MLARPFIAPKLLPRGDGPSQIAYSRFGRHYVSLLAMVGAHGLSVASRTLFWLTQYPGNLLNWQATFIEAACLPMNFRPFD